MIIHSSSYPRAALIGNPSDGYFGKVLSFTFKNFSANVELHETPKLELLPDIKDHLKFDSIHSLAEDIRHFGYYGGIRLLKAAIKKFYDHCQLNKVKFDNRNFTIRYNTNIPQHVGLAGSSAIITACMKGLMAFYNVDIPKPILANLILAAENEELNIPAGLQDRVAQAYNGVVYMDFNKDYFEKHGHGIYEEIDPGLLPPLYIAYRTSLSEGSEVFHNNIRHRFKRGEKKIIDAMASWAGLAEKARVCLINKKIDRMEKIGILNELLNKNFDIRKTIYNISEENIEMADAARSVGASSKFTGSGGAIVGIYKDENMYAKLQDVMKKLDIQVLKPVLTCAGDKEKL